MTLLKGLPPILPNRPRALILGSMPSARSLVESQYYAHPQNLFWSLLAEVVGVFPPPAAYRARVDILRRAGVAVWDVLGECRRNGSADSAILRDSERANDIAGLLANHPSVRVIALNGGRAKTCFLRHIAPSASPMPVLFLPSTSPANAGMSRARKLAEWNRLAPFLHNGGGEK